MNWNKIFRFKKEIAIKEYVTAENLIAFPFVHDKNKNLVIIGKEKENGKKHK